MGAGRQSLTAWMFAILFAFFLPFSAHAAKPLVYNNSNSTITKNTTWSGTVVVGGVVFVPDGVTLKIAPGTTVLFKKIAAAPGNAGDESRILIPGSGIRVEGKIIAEGEKGKEIIFTSAAGRPASATEAGRPAKPGDWGCIFLDHSTGDVFYRCRFEYSAYTIHAHFSRLSVSRCVITKNKDGSRLGVCRASFDHCEIKGNSGKGLNFRQSKVDVTFCDITNNRDGIFLNAKDSACAIEHNNIYGNRGMNLRLGDFHKDDVTLAEDWWGPVDRPRDISEIKKKVYDKSSDPAIGRADIIFPLSRAVIGAGTDGPGIEIKWKFKAGAYVDGGAVEDNGAVYFGSWDKNFYAVRADNGKLIWNFDAGDCVDSTPAIAGGKIYFGSWNRYIYCLNEKDGKLIWKFRMPPSNFDDHRQASPVIGENYGYRNLQKPVLFMGGFNGILYALDASNGKELWEFKTGGPIRSKAVYKSWVNFGIGPIGITFLVNGSADGNLYVLNFYRPTFDPESRKVWQFKTGGAVYSSPSIDFKNIIKPSGCADCESGKAAEIYFGSQDGNLYCIGKYKWVYLTHSIIVYSSPLIYKDLVYIGDCAGTLHAVNKDTGKGVWKFTGGGVIYSSPVAAWAGRPAAGAASNPAGGVASKAVSGENILYGDNSGDVYCLNPNTGGLLAFFKAGNAVQNVTTGPGGATVYASSRDGYLYALTLSGQ